MFEITVTEINTHLKKKFQNPEKIVTSNSYKRFVISHSMMSQEL